MPLTKNALIRYKTIDNCLRNRCKRWTLDMLVDACSEALYDYEGVGNISKRTVQLDLQMMRSDRYGYNAGTLRGDQTAASVANGFGT